MALLEINVPKMFFTDHRERELDTPAVIGRRGNSILIDAADPAVPELFDDADFYCEADGFDRELRSLSRADA